MQSYCEHILICFFKCMISRRGNYLYFRFRFFKARCQVQALQGGVWSHACTSCILNRARCNFGVWHRWSLERTTLHAPYLVISRNAMVSFLCQDACKEKMVYSLASWNGRRDGEGRGGPSVLFSSPEVRFWHFGKETYWSSSSRRGSCSKSQDWRMQWCGPSRAR